MTRKTALSTLALASALLLGGCDQYPPVESTQSGFRGTAMVGLSVPKEEAAKRARNTVPAALPQVPASGGPKARDVYQNVQVLGELEVGQFGRLMSAMTSWISPQEGCVYCHNPANFADDSKYQKVVARRMVEMTRHINGSWSAHVQQTGVTCYTCHAGKHIPENLWSRAVTPPRASSFSGNRMGQNEPVRSVALSSLPGDPYSRFLLAGAEIRVNATYPLPMRGAQPPGTQAAEHTYGLMMHMSDALGVNCTFCHNSRAFANWQQSTPQRVTAWHGIRMLRDVNAAFVEPLSSVFPPARLGAAGDALKANCSTCHQGVNKPLYGVSMLKDYPELGAQSPPQ
jgi:photosynthetic reaction center cytochrome c subunit